MKTLSNKTEQIYEFIKTFTAENGYAPTVREIGSHFSISSTSNVFYYLEKLKKSGKITTEQNKYRSLRVCDSNKAEYSIAPLLGNVSAGTGIFAEENFEGYYALPKEIYDKQNQFLLRVEGDSMTNIGIDDGDFVVVTRQSAADIDDIVVVFWQEKATVKRLKCLEPLILHPENNTMQDIVLSQSDNPVILGKVIGCLKKF